MICGSDGLKGGDHLIISGTPIFCRTAMPVMEQIQSKGQSQYRAGSHLDLMSGAHSTPRKKKADLPALFVDFFIRRRFLPRSAHCSSFLRERSPFPTLRSRNYPTWRLRKWSSAAATSEQNAQTVENRGHHSAGTSYQRRAGHEYISSTSGNDGSSQITVVFDVTRKCRPGRQ